MVLSSTPRTGASEEAYLIGSPQALALVPHATAVKYSVFAERIDGNELAVVVPEAADDDVIDRIRALTGMRVSARTASREQLRRSIASAYAHSADAIAEPANDPPAIRAVDAMHDAAVQRGASDVHVEPGLEGGRIRFRVDGMLTEAQAIPKALYLPVVSRIKLLASLDIAERRAPQDGRYTIERSGKMFDARVSTVPTIAGERVVIRLLDMQARIPTLESLGMEPSILRAYRRAIHASHGFVVVCGPTGSGKTTTLYASLAERNVSSQHLCSVEDPVEIQMPGVAQVQVNLRAGVDFAGALRAFLRQDPNVIMLGEMRDEESARVALSASLAGQLVMTTLHASDAPRSIERLAELGLGRQTLASGLTAVVGQRLLRKLCPRCKRGAEPTGCSDCDGTGYRGRVGVFELMEIDDDVRQAIASGEPTWRIATLAERNGYQPMIASAQQLVGIGETSSAEVRRVLESSAA